MLEYAVYIILISLMLYMVWEAWRMLKREEEKCQESLERSRELDMKYGFIENEGIDDDPL